MSVDVQAEIMIARPAMDAAGRAGGPPNAQSMRNQGEPSGFPMLAAPFMTMAMRRANRKYLAKLGPSCKMRRPHLEPDSQERADGYTQAERRGQAVLQFPDPR